MSVVVLPREVVVLLYICLIFSTLWKHLERGELRRCRFHSKVMYFFGLMGLVSSEDEGLDSFSFHKFSGPVSGEARRIVVPNTHPNRQGSHSVDYVAKPDYSFTYGVHDGNSENSQTHTESRTGDAVHGEYRVLQPDGLVRIVRYTADPTTGFKATVEYAPL